ncbi:MAG: UDP-N-acetylmuramoyl-L-alanyl-D-glutamate--2,6-diaminopimelate ligase [Saprospiraceae bacterium]|nr:UDP-N-acetylmuramoyl-L-alanyl-D-glutamate--2,6-diaminopimelate ligase [Saprospiraceae bacterium]
MIKQNSNLQELVPEHLILEISGDLNKSIQSIEIDSRKVIKDSLFIAFKGLLTDGHNYIAKAIENGATCLLCEVLPDSIQREITYIKVADARAVAGLILKKYYAVATDRVKLIGVTGTNGKTTVATLMYQLFSTIGYKCGLISTVENLIDGEILPSSYTTPDVVNLHKLIAEMVSRDCKYIFMEVSSHAIDQQRISGLDFTGAIFTNITHDHLDYHGTFKNYINAKKKFFDDLNKEAFVLVNTDDKNGKVMVQNTTAKVKTYGLRSMTDYKAKIIDSSVQGLHLKINGNEVHFRMIGEFNAYNILAVYGASVELGEKSDEVLSVLSGLRGAEGRFEQIYQPSRRISAIVDYAHTPDALENVLTTIKKVKKMNTSVITVVGCGGDRDKTKRPVMAKVAADLSDKLIMTSDNPRSEDPEKILDDMEAGLDSTDKLKVLRIADRMQAIKTALMIANPDDIILVAGKGHEKYQEIKGEKFPFDDIATLRTLMK